MAGDAALTGDRGEVGLVFAIRLGSGAGGWGGGAALAGSEDELLGGVGCVFFEEHVTAGAVEQRGEDDGAFGRAVGTEDALITDAAGDLEVGEAGDVAEDLVEGGVVGDDGELALGKGDAGAVRWVWCRSRGWLEDSGWGQRREGLGRKWEGGGGEEEEETGCGRNSQDGALVGMTAACVGTLVRW